MLTSRARIQPGEDVLGLAGSSGVGSAAIQIAKMLQLPLTVKRLIHGVV
jgi:NADPH:quinone reductase-like Zn-dependent oxidoreductase